MLQNLEVVGRFNARGLAEFAELLRSPLVEVLENINDLLSKKELSESYDRC